MNSIHILLAEDNEGDILLIKEAFKEGRVLNTISTVKDGEKAVLYLKKEGVYAESITPDLILLDVNMPRKNGHEVLEFIKNDETFKQIPVIMLTTSSSENDIMKSYKNHANCYITKPVEIDDFLQAIKKIESFWIQLVKLPSKG